MFPIPNVTNSGTMPISGGDATSGNGDSAFSNRSKFGGLNYNKGLPQWLIYAGLGLAAFMVLRGKR